MATAALARDPSYGVAPTLQTLVKQMSDRLSEQEEVIQSLVRVARGVPQLQDYDKLDEALVYFEWLAQQKREDHL